jgi:hypothetical protein
MNWKDQLLAEEERKFEKLCSTRSCKIWADQRARTHLSALAANHIGLLVDPALTRCAGTSAAYLWLFQVH